MADLHVHSIASGHAYSTIQEIARAAADKGLEMVAVTDHGPSMPGGPHEYYFGNLHVVPAVLHGVEILRGAEANVIDARGGLDLKEYYLKRLDLVLAGFHNQCLEPACREENTRAMIAALDNPYVDIIVHPGNPDYPIDAEAVVKAAAERGKALEINNSSFLVRIGSRENCREIAALVRQYRARISISSDAHISVQVGELSHAMEVALEAGVPEECVVNMTAERVKEFLQIRGKRRFARR